MKKLLTSLLLATFLFPTSSAFAEDDGFLSVRLVISDCTTADDLNRMQGFMEDNGYRLEIEEAVYDDQGRLTSVRGSVDFKKSSGTFYAPDLSKAFVLVKKGLLGRMSIELQKVE